MASSLTSAQAFMALVGAYVTRLNAVTFPGAFDWPTDGVAASTDFRQLLGALKAAPDPNDVLVKCTYTVDGRQVTAQLTQFECDALNP